MASGETRHAHMKVVDPTGISTAPTLRRARRVSSSKDDFARHLNGSAAAEPGVSIPPSAPAAILALQEWGTFTGEHPTPEEQKRRGRELLDRLDEIRLGLLLGRIDRGTLEALAARLREGRARTGEPGLDRAIREIELRAEVELAKYGSAAGAGRAAK